MSSLLNVQPRRALACLGAAAMLTACDASSDKNTKPQAPPSPSDAELAKASLTKLPNADRLKLAFQAATGRKKAYKSVTSEGTRIYRPMMLLETDFGPVLLTANHLVDGCHACVGGVSIYYLEYKKGGYSVGKSWKDIITSDWGTSPKVRVSKAFTTYPALISTGGYFGQGYSYSSVQIVTLLPEGPKSSDGISTGCSNAGAFGEGDPRSRTYEGKFVDVMKDKSFSVKFNNNGKLVQKYIMRQGSFKIVKPEIQLEGC